MSNDYAALSLAPLGEGGNCNPLTFYQLSAYLRHHDRAGVAVHG
jgi:hypothetical protein